MPLAPATPLPAKGNQTKPIDHYGLMLSTTVDRQAEILQSDDGFEKRYLHRCGRCSLVIGYQLDWALFENSGEGENKAGRREDVVYLLPGGLLSTSEMVMGKKPSEGAVGIVSVTEIKT
jgi:hypothetical protein